MFLGLDALTWAFVAAGLVVAAVIFVRNMKGGRAYEWDPRPPTQNERLIAGIWMVAFFVVEASYLAGWRVLGDYDKQGSAALLLVGLVLFYRIFPGVRRA
jgi:hypothetical protein